VPRKQHLADGTSLAASCVSGVAALLFSRYPQASAAQVKQAIVASCTLVSELLGRVGCGDRPCAGARSRRSEQMLGETWQQG
jgi:Subtilase family